MGQGENCVLSLRWALLLRPVDFSLSVYYTDLVLGEVGGFCSGTVKPAPFMVDKMKLCIQKTFFN